MLAADAVVSKVVDLLVSATQQGFSLFSGVEQEFERITSGLRVIQLELTDAEQRQWKEENVQIWLRSLKSLAYDIDDVIDEINYKYFRRRILRRKVWSFLIGPPFPSSVLCHQIVAKIQELDSRLGSIGFKRDLFRFESFRRSYEHVECNTTTSDFDMAVVKGRDAEKKILVNLLLTAGSSKLRMLHPISIVGTRGIGKTTLAKLVYDCERCCRVYSLIVLPPKKYSSVEAQLPNLLKELTCLRSLSLSRCGLESIPSSINKLLHLRWLKLSKNYALKELPETICVLYNLQTLSVNWCTGLTRFPKGVEKLANLRILKNDYTYFLLPKGIGKLWDLRKLPRITIDPKFKDSFSLQDLKSLNDIGGSLTIFFVERKRDRLVKDAKKALLSEKKHITTLSLNFPEKAPEKWMEKDDEELVEALKPSQSLEMLRITNYTGKNCPSCIISLASLKRLKLWYWSNCQHLPALAKLPCLEYVEFNNFRRVKKVGAEFYKMDGVIEASTSTAPLFPKLKNLQLMNMSEWEEWNNYEGDEQVMPCLSYLSIQNCPKLKALLNFILEKDALQKQIS